MKLCILISSLRAGGAEKIATSLANHWAECTIPVSLVTLTGDDDRPFFPLRPEVTLVRLGVTGSSTGLGKALVANAHRVLVLRRTILKLKPDAVVAFGDRISMLTLLGAWRLVPVVVAERSNPAVRDPGRVWRNLRPILYRCAAALVVQTSGAAQSLKPFCPRLFVIANPVALPLTRGFRKSSHTIVSAGRLIPSKGFDILLHAFAIVSARHPRWSLCIWGQGPERLLLEKLASTLGIRDRVRFAGLAQGPEEWTQTGEVFVTASRFEGFPNVLAEAMAAGMAVISTDCHWGPSELIDHGSNGLLVPVDNAIALGDAVDRVLGSAELRAQLSAAAPAVLNRFSPTRIFARWDEVMRFAIDRWASCPRVGHED